MKVLQFLVKLILNRNVILVMAVILGFLIGDLAVHLKAYTIYILAITMVMSTTGISTKALFPLQKLVKPFLIGTFLNYIVFGIVIIGLAWLLFPEIDIFVGFVVIAAAPPGVAVIPFTEILDGDINFAIIGVFGAFLASIFIAPAMIGLFPGGENVNTLHLFILMVELIIIPIVLSRFLLHPKVFGVVKKIRGKVVDYGFALIIFTAVGMNKDILFNDYRILINSLIILISGTFILGSAFEFFAKKTGMKEKLITPHTLLLTIKSSGFSVVTAMALFGEKAAIPSAVLAIIVLLYLLFLSIRSGIKKEKKV